MWTCKQTPEFMWTASEDLWLKNDKAKTVLNEIKYVHSYVQCFLLMLLFVAETSI